MTGNLAPAFPTLPAIAPDSRSFSRTYRVRFDEVDDTRRVRLDGIARHVQNISADMIDSSPFLQSDPLWILRRTVIDVIEPISWPADVTVIRWCSATSTRWVNMRQTLTSTPEPSAFNPEVRTPGLVETESFCIKVTADGRLSRISEEALDFLGAGVTDTRLRWKPLNADPVPEPSHGDFPFAARATDIDQFGHVNNAIHWQIVEQALADRPDLHAGRFRAVIEYLHPIPPNTSVAVRYRDTDDSLTLWIMTDPTTVAATATVHRHAGPDRLTD